MNHQVLYFIFGILLFGTIQAAWIDNGNRGGPLKTQYKRQFEGGCFHNMCNDTNGYPEDEIRQLIAKTSGYEKLFGTVTKPYRRISVASRGGLDDDDIPAEKEKNMCRTQPHYTTPKRAQDVHGIWQIVVNGEGMEQLVEYETCEEGAICDADGQIPGYAVSCRAQTITIRLFAFIRTPSGDSELRLKTFPVPAGCYCAMKYNNFRGGRQQIDD
ncbi:Spaetzle [Popillia japonica]|uniref:Spaetzle n=1 Tax=Popillia japonica TaxID=7064 RepID=A0AAW1J1H4_POPJA